MQYAIVENNVVVNIAVAAAPLADNWHLAPGAGIGWTFDGQTFAPPEPAIVLPTLEDYDAALTAHLDATAQTRKYVDRISCAVRAGYPGPFQAEGIAFATWMDAQNAKGYQVLADYQSGLIPQPTIEAFLGMLDPMVWPD